MSLIKIKCPSCQSALQISEQKLRETQGRVQCDSCQHVFKLVKKKKSESNPTPEPAVMQKQTKETKQKVLDKEPVQKKSKTKTTEKQPLSYRIPKAQAKPQFAEVNQQKNMPFNLLEQPTANLNIPQVSIKPSQINAPAMSNTSTADQQNNITIHTDSLVFTLVGDGSQEGGMSMGSPNNASKSPVLLSGVAHDLNWTIAVIAALIVLIMQLFYWVLLWK